MYRISSESNRFSTFVVPSAKAANNKILFDKDFDPGRRTVPSIFLIGFNVKVSSTAADWATDGCARETRFLLACGLLFL